MWGVSAQVSKKVTDLCERCQSTDNVIDLLEDNNIFNTARASSKVAALGWVSRARSCSFVPHCARSRANVARSTRSISAGANLGICPSSARDQYLKHVPADKRPARPIRCVASALDALVVIRRDIPVPA